MSGILTWVLAAWLSAMLVALTVKGISAVRRSPTMLRDEPFGPIRPERVQAVVLVVLFATAYAITGLTSIGNIGGGALPTPPDWLVAMLAASQSVYLSGKIVRQEHVTGGER